MNKTIEDTKVLVTERVRKEYITTATKIWMSELWSFNEDIFNEAYAISSLSPTGGIINWTIDSFHSNSDVEKC